MRIRLTRPLQLTLIYPQPDGDLKVSEEDFPLGTEFIVGRTLPHDCRKYDSPDATTFILCKVGAFVVITDGAWLPWKRVFKAKEAEKILRVGPTTIYKLFGGKKEGGVRIPGEKVWSHLYGEPEPVQAETEPAPVAKRPKVKSKRPKRSEPVLRLP